MRASECAESKALKGRRGKEGGMRITQENSILLVIDFQERLMPAINEGDEVEKNAARLVAGCGLLGVPMIATEQYPKGLGPTRKAIREALRQARIIAKTSFNALDEPEVGDFVKNALRLHVIICGVESHICVLQTALAVKSIGFVPVIAADCVGSRKPQDREFALRRAENEGMILSTHEALLYEIMKDSGHPAFKEISKLIK